MKKTTLILMIIIGLCTSDNIYAQIGCVEVIFPFCPKVPQTQMPPDTVNINPNCPNIEIIDSTDYGIISHVGTDGNFEDRFGNRSYFYELDTTSNCFADQFTVVECCDNTGVLVCDTITYEIEPRCDTPDDVFCCIPPDGDPEILMVLQNDSTFINTTYPGSTILATNIMDVTVAPGLGGIDLQGNTLYYTSDASGFDTIFYNVLYEIITADGDTVTICDEQLCYVFVESCLNTMPDIEVIFVGDTICIDPLANDLVEPTLYDSILDSIGCTNPDPLPLLDPATLTPPLPLNGAPPLSDDGAGGWCFTDIVAGVYDYTYEVCTDAGSCETSTIQVNLFPTCVQDDYIALRALYLSTNGDCWLDNTGWPDAATFMANPTPPPGTDLSTWYGVNVNAGTGCVENIYLSNNNLNGTLPPELALFADRLYVLSLEENRIYGNIPPELGSLIQLTNLILDNNQLTGRIPGMLGNISTLTDLTLFDNQLSGCYDSNLLLLCTSLSGPYNNNTSISDGNNFDADWEDFCIAQTGLCNCLNDDYTALRALYLSTDGDNWLNNTGWPAAANFPATPPPGTDVNTWYGVTTDAAACVINVSLVNNNLNGTIPTEFDRLANLVSLNLSFNQLTGNIPATLGNLTNLSNLDLSDNQLIGTLPPELGYLNQLNILDVRENQFEGCFDIKLLDLCDQLAAALVDAGNDFDAPWADFCSAASGACSLPGNCLTNVQLHVYLEGAYDTNAGIMRTDLNTLRHILPGQTPSSPLTLPTPAGQPYNIAPWNYSGTEGAGWTDADYPASVVDWVIVSFRTSIDRNTEIDRVAALLHDDGSVSFPGYGLFLPNSNPVYIIVEHRNHMGVMTPAPVSLSGNTLIYDFRAANSYNANGTAGFGQKEIATGLWTMYGGDSNQFDFPGYDINGGDNLLWKAQNGSFNLYTQADMNMNGDVNGGDRIIWNNNNGYFSVVPR